MTTPSHWSGEAWAKLNLRLRVFDCDETGYHGLETVFQTLELADRVDLLLLPEGPVTLEVTGVSEGVLGADEDNLAVRAARLFQDATGAGAAAGAGAATGVEIGLEKRIPHGAGLGGGSADAAAVLRGLNEMAGEPLGREELMELGSQLGSDVPFLVSGAARALGLGRGERILPLPGLPVREVLLVAPTEPISTAWAYRVLDNHRTSRAGPRPGHERGGDGAPDGGAETRVSPAESDWPAVAAAATNDFEEALFPLRPDLGRIKEVLHSAGARPALLTGSGSCVFGAFETVGKRERAEQALGTMGEPGLRTIRTRTR